MRAIILLIVVLAAANIEAYGTSCAAKLDACFVVDGSDSVCAFPDVLCLHWQFVLKFMAEVVERWTIGPDDTKVAVVTFGSAAKVEWNLNNYTEKGSLLEAIYHVKYPGGILNTPGLVGAIVNLIYTQAAGERSYARNATFLITDGAPYIDPAAAAASSAALQAKGIDVFVVCIKPCEEAFAKALSSQPQEKDVTYFMVDDYLFLYEVIDTLEKQLCG